MIHNLNDNTYIYVRFIYNVLESNKWYINHNLPNNNSGARYHKVTTLCVKFFGNGCDSLRANPKSITHERERESMREREKEY